MPSPRKKLAPETMVADQAALIALLVQRCKEQKLATSSIDKLEGVGSPWLHNLMAGRQRSTELLNLFPLLSGLGLELVVRVKKPSRQSEGQRIVHKLRSSRAKQLAVLTEDERAEVEAALGSDEQPPDAQAHSLAPELVEAREMAKNWSK